ncbi:hypothetical protein HDU89_006066 [Geranomyces variabilis]|nr:hypothetical protein HDU89_006066 [Geranomyces variabilis]
MPSTRSAAPSNRPFLLLIGPTERSRALSLTSTHSSKLFLSRATFAAVPKAQPTRHRGAHDRLRARTKSRVYDPASQCVLETCDVRFDKQSALSLPPPDITIGNHYQVERIVSENKKNRTVEVKWVGWDDTTIEPLSELEDTEAYRHWLARYNVTALLTASETEPKTIKEALESADKDQWAKAIVLVIGKDLPPEYMKIVRPWVTMCRAIEKAAKDRIAASGLLASLDATKGRCHNTSPRLECLASPAAPVTPSILIELKASRRIKRAIERSAVAKQFPALGTPNSPARAAQAEALWQSRMLPLGRHLPYNGDPVVKQRWMEWVMAGGKACPSVMPHSCAPARRRPSAPRNAAR